MRQSARILVAFAVRSVAEPEYTGKTRDDMALVTEHWE